MCAGTSVIYKWKGKHRHTVDRCVDKYKYNGVMFTIVCKAGLGCIFSVAASKMLQMSNVKLMFDFMF